VVAIQLEVKIKNAEKENQNILTPVLLCGHSY
jgi:hypothetical protein